MNALDIPTATREALRQRVLQATDADRPTTLSLMRYVKERELTWPVSRVTRARTHDLLRALGLHHDYESGHWYEKRPVPEPTPFNLLNEAIEVIEGLADQQAMADDWYEEPLGRLKEELEKMRPGA
jgi:hypothetical protein